MSPTQREKTQAHAEHVLDAFIALSATYAMLEPLLFDANVIERWSGKKRRFGFNQIRHSLLYACVLSIAKIALDNDKRTPSITNLVRDLDNPPLVSELRERYAAGNLVLPEDEDPEVVKVLHRMAKREEAQRRVQFDSLLEELRKGWAELSESAALTSCGAMRDKLIAHSEMVLHYESRYRPFDLSMLGLRYGDLRLVIEALQRLVDLLSVLFRGSNFAFDEMDQQFTAGRDQFWKAEP
jgi:hypothetical protein